MAERVCIVPEEQWIDWLQGKLGEDAREALGRHLEHCEACRSTLREWQALLGAAEVASNEFPGKESNRAALRRAVRRIGWRRSAARLGSGGGWLVAAACALLIMIAVPLLMNDRTVERELRIPAQAYAEAYAPNAATLMGRPDTVVYAWQDASGALSLSPEVARPAATVWMNVRTGEMFLLLEGLLPSDWLDVQAWGHLNNHATNLGLLEFHRDQGHLYSRIDQLPAFEEVAFTIEPKGGSESPTTPQSMAVRLVR